jgi:glutaminase
MSFTTILQEIQQESNTFAGSGSVTATIPELAKVNPNKFGIHLTTIEGEDWG